VEAIATYSTLAVTLGLVATRPRIGQGFRLSPAVAASLGVLVMIALGVVHQTDLRDAALVLWRPVVAIVCIMITAAAARAAGVLDAVAALTIGRLRGDATKMFSVVFALGAAASAILNNDAAVLLLTPIVVATARARFFGRPRVVAAFAFAIFMAAGVAPLVVSNPMNMVVASCAHIGFNEYAVRMIPVAVAGWIVAYVMLRLVFRRALSQAGEAGAATPASSTKLAGAQKALLVLLGVVVVAYSVASFYGAPLWPVAVAGAAAAILLAARAGASPVRVLAKEVSWDVVVFLGAVFLLAVGLRNVGVVKTLAGLYAKGGPVAIGGASALGSAMLNNHPMAILNVLALDGARKTDVLAALVGGDIGPRLFPTGSLAGLLWLESLRRARVDVPVTRFVLVGAAVALPSLAVSLLVLFSHR
jgi:arsenical pump membrane protein